MGSECGICENVQRGENNIKKIKQQIKQNKQKVVIKRVYIKMNAIFEANNQMNQLIYALYHK